MILSVKSLGRFWHSDFLLNERFFRFLNFVDPPYADFEFVFHYVQ
jgi:hypothetical protein